MSDYIHAEEEYGTYGIVAQFDSPEKLIVASEAVRLEGYTRTDSYTPFPVHGLSEAMGETDVRVKWIVFIAGLIGCAVGYGLQYWTSVVVYPHNAGGRPLHSWVSFIPVTFECTVLFAAFGAVFGMLGLNGLPRPYHSVFNTPEFERATQDRFFLAIEADDPLFDSDKTMSFLRGLGAERVSEVEK